MCVCICSVHIYSVSVCPCAANLYTGVHIFYPRIIHDVILRLLCTHLSFQPHRLQDSMFTFANYSATTTLDLPNSRYQKTLISQTFSPARLSICTNTRFLLVLTNCGLKNIYTSVSKMWSKQLFG